MSIKELMARFKKEYPSLRGVEKQWKQFHNSYKEKGMPELISLYKKIYKKKLIPLEYAGSWDKHTKSTKSTMVLSLYNVMKKRLKKGGSLIWIIKPEICKIKENRKALYTRFVIIR